MPISSSPSNRMCFRIHRFRSGSSARLCIADCLRGQIDCQGVAFSVLCSPEKFIDLGFGESHGKKTVHKGVAVENIGIAWRDQDSKAVIGDTAHGACSRLEPQPKHTRASRTDAPLYRGQFRTKSDSAFPGKVTPIVEQDLAISLLGLELPEFQAAPFDRCRRLPGPVEEPKPECLEKGCICPPTFVRGELTNLLKAVLTSYLVATRGQGSD